MKLILAIALIAALWAVSPHARADQGAISPPAWVNQCITGDCSDGYGKMTFTGYTYEGEFSNGRRNGFATLTHMDGNRMIGIWVDDEISEGIHFLPNGDRYLGQWKYWERNGEGILFKSDGWRYVGEFKSGRRHGWGILTYPDGRKYTGEFNKGQRTGWGMMTYPDGRRYMGEFQNGARTGQGTLTYPGGRSINGQFKDGELIVR